MFDPRLTRPHYKTVIFASYLELLSKNRPEINVNILVEKAGLSLEYVRDENNWVSVTFEKRIMDLIIEQTGDPNIFFAAGEQGVSRTGLGEGLHFLASNFIPLDAIYRSLPKLTGLLNKVISVEITERRSGHFKFLFKPKLDELDTEEREILVSRMPYVMANTMGYYSKIPTLKRLPPAQTTVTQVDAELGSYSLELSFFEGTLWVAPALKTLPILSFFGLVWGMLEWARFPIEISLLAAASAVTMAIAFYFSYQNRKLRGVAAQSEQSLYRLDIQNKDLYDAKLKLKRKLDESLATFELVTHMISATLEEEVLEFGCECLVNNLKYDRAFVLIYDSQANCLRLAASKGLSDQLKAGMEKLVLPVEIDDSDPTKFSNVFRMKQPLLVKDVTEHMSRLADPTSLMVLKVSGSRSFVAAPLFTQNKSLGILVADCISKQKVMTEDDLRLISTAAQQIAIGIEQQRSKQELIDGYQKELELSESYSRFVPFETLELLKYKNIVDVKIGDYVETHVAIMFSDIRGFTTLCETMTPADILKFLNSYYARLSPVIKSHGGTIDKFMGDGIMAIFSKADQALAAAVDMQRSIFKYNLDRHDPQREPIQAGIGIAAGKVVFGSLGTDKRLELTAIADTVNVASRLDGLCRETGQTIMITGYNENTLGQFPQLSFSHLLPLKVKGRASDVHVIAVNDLNYFSAVDETQLSPAQKVYLAREREFWLQRQNPKQAA